MAGKLCYLAAQDVEIPEGTLAGLDLCSLDQKRLGTLDGVIIDAAARRVRYYVVAAKGWFSAKRFLLPADQPTHLETDEHIMRIELDADDVRRAEFNRDSVRAFSDEDLMAALFSTHAA
jgi:PRC-barrel domain